jgi:hypothetical protein
VRRRQSRRSEINIPNQWECREHQRPLFNYFNGEEGRETFHDKRAIVFAHRRWGKDSVAVNLMAMSAALWPGNYVYMFPLLVQARAALWTNFDRRRGGNVLDLAFPHEIRKRTDKNAMFIELVNGSTIQLLGSDNYNALVGGNYFGLVFSEWALSDPESWAYLRPILTENRGWSLFISTPRGKNHAHRMYETAVSEPDHWFSLISTVDDTDVISNERLAIDHREWMKLYGEVQGDAYFRQEYFCEFDSPILGAVYADAMKYLEAEGRICPLKIEPGIPVHTGWDLGVSDSTAIWFIQCVGRNFHAVDYYESSGAPLHHYVEVLHEKRIKRGFRFGQHFLPHDVKHRELNTAMSRVETLRSLGVEVEVVPAHHKLDSVNAVRRILDRTKIDSARCERGLDCLKNYRYEWREKQRIWTAQPLHDWSSHGADALATFATGFDEPSVTEGQKRRRDSDSFRSASHWAS